VVLPICGSGIFSLRENVSVVFRPKGAKNGKVINYFCASKVFGILKTFFQKGFEWV
jgi:hypothetical protein